MYEALLLFLVTCLSAMDKIETLSLSGHDLEGNLSKQEPIKVIFDGALTISLPIYFVKYCREPLMDTALELAKDKKLLKTNLNSLPITPTSIISSHVCVTKGFFEDYPQHFATVHEMSHLIVDGCQTYREENNAKKIFCTKLFWINKQLALHRGSSNSLYLITLHETTNTFACSEMDMAKNYVHDFAQHPLHWDEFYVVLTKSPSVLSIAGYFLKIKITNSSFSFVSAAKKLAFDACSPLLITPHDCNMSLIISPCNTFYLLGKKSYHNNGTYFKLDLQEGIKRLRLVHKLVTQDFEKACKNSEAAPDKDTFFANHHLRRKFLDHWISYKIAQIEGK